MRLLGSGVGDDGDGGGDGIGGVLLWRSVCAATSLRSGGALQAESATEWRGQLRQAIGSPSHCFGPRL